ncbi:tyrosine-type recombinase/integrase [Mammaliicoccus sciuri]|uniref:tyrosine-type recombinase/integrase n=1 Tax=Mammaliicoccus sciuri TaxID=1296 RepID=UPI001A9990CB|nr:site-specific integrase [Mammaliicoccus sciuri]MBO1232585.1 site-specific integrase [Mammaliicoccus sciuri]
MYLIKDIKMKYGTLYKKILDLNFIEQKLGALGFVKVSQESNLTYFMVMDQDGRLNEEINYYLNVILKSAGYKTRENAYNALKVLYSYCLVFDIEKIEDFTEIEVNKLIHFLYGGKYEGTFLSFDISTIRRKDTVLNYLNIYSQYYKSYSNKPTSPFENTQYIPTSNYKENRVISHPITHINPTKYINRNQFNRIQKIIVNNYSVREQIIINLMYFYGLRIGEVLGITLEDLKTDNHQYKLIIRNRLTDKSWQKAKSVLTPTYKNDYFRDIFNEYDSGFQIIYITKDMFGQFDRYIEESRTSSSLMNSSKRLTNLNNDCAADKIDKSSNTIENQYIFLSKNLFKPLTSAGWNNILRNIFQQAGIPIDQDKRRMNLNHKFRHGYAMNLVEEEISPNQLAKRMRHKSVASSYKYYNPDEEDQFKILEKYKESIGDKYDFRI